MRGGAGASWPSHQLGIKGRSGWISPLRACSALDSATSTTRDCIFSPLFTFSVGKSRQNSCPWFSASDKKTLCSSLFLQLSQLRWGISFLNLFPQKAFVTEPVRRVLVCWTVARTISGYSKSSLSVSNQVKGTCRCLLFVSLSIASFILCILSVLCGENLRGARRQRCCFECISVP